MFENPATDLEALINLLSMSDEQRREDAVYSLGYFIREYTSVVEDVIGSPETSNNIRAELTEFTDDDIGTTDLSSEAVEALAAQVDLGSLIPEVAAIDPTEVPLWAAASLLHPTIKTGWLAHYTDSGDHIEQQGLTKGVSDIYLLLLTTALGEYDKSEPGYNFAFEPKDAAVYAHASYGEPKYGSDIILLRAPYVLIWHEWDEEPQAIFWGPDATDITRAWDDDGSVVIEGADGDDLEFDSLEDAVAHLDASGR